MRGEVLHYDEDQGFGFIAGADGNRYTFRREDLKQVFAVPKGAAVEFRESGVQARDVASAAAEAPPPAAVTNKSLAVPRIAAAAPSASVDALPQQFGRNANGDAAIPSEASSTGLWSYFWAAITTNYANFRGRAPRKEYWGFLLFYWLGITLLTMAGLAVDASTGNLDWGAVFPLMATVLIVLPALLASLVPGIAITVRRFHDIGLSGWFYLLMWVIGFLLAGAVMILAIILGLIPSQKRENKWGPVPAGVVV